MKILFTTDLHGNDKYYFSILSDAIKHQVDIVINGSDMLPKIGDPFVKQPHFIKRLEKRYFSSFEQEKIHYICCLGNDDLRVFDQEFDDACNRFEYVHNIPQRKIEIGGLEFIGFNLVKDYRFQLKDRCRMDSNESDFPKQNGPGLISTLDGMKEIVDWPLYAKSIPTIEDELKNLIKPNNIKKAVYIVHQPPFGIGLDVREDDGQVGSKAVYDFFANEQPFLALHGHVHASYQMTGIWKAEIGETICIQPGQGSHFSACPTYVLINTETMEMQRKDY